MQGKASYAMPREITCKVRHAMHPRHPVAYDLPSITKHVFLCAVVHSDYGRICTCMCVCVRRCVCV